MTATQLNAVTAQANAICGGTGVLCKYEFDRKARVFRWNFYRRGVFVGGTSRETEVCSKAKRLVQTRG